jgi:hypothetical protein
MTCPVKCLKHVAFDNIHAPCFNSLFARVFYRKTGIHFCEPRFKIQAMALQ